MVSPAPQWLITAVRDAKKGQGAEKIEHTRSLIERFKLSTVCETAECPNRGECFSNRTATFLILGDICTRGCAFCAVHRGHPLGPPDEQEPELLAQAVIELGLRHVVITSVTRDDLSDGGSNHYARVVEALRLRCPDVKIELLVPDFCGSGEALATVLASNPDIFAHNIETVHRLYSGVRKGANYQRSLTVLKKAKEISPEVITKSGIMLGLGEERQEVEEALRDLRKTGCDMLTLGQYLSPSLAHAPVIRYVTPEEFAGWRQEALDMGFKSVASGPLVRSSYKAPVFFEELR
jgi:lipoic acid synthetase